MKRSQGSALLSSREQRKLARENASLAHEHTKLGKKNEQLTLALAAALSRAAEAEKEAAALAPEVILIDGDDDDDHSLPAAEAAPAVAAEAARAVAAPPPPAAAAAAAPAPPAATAAAAAVVVKPEIRIGGAHLPINVSTVAVDDLTEGYNRRFGFRNAGNSALTIEEPGLRVWKTSNDHTRTRTPLVAQCLPLPNTGVVSFRLCFGSGVCTSFNHFSVTLDPSAFTLGWANADALPSEQQLSGLQTVVPAGRLCSLGNVMEWYPRGARGLSCDFFFNMDVRKGFFRIEGGSLEHVPDELVQPGSVLSIWLGIHIALAVRKMHHIALGYWKPSLVLQDGVIRMPAGPAL